VILKQCLLWTGLVAMATLLVFAALRSAPLFEKEQPVELSLPLKTAAKRCPRPLAQSETLYLEDITIKGYTNSVQLEKIGANVYSGDMRHPGAFYYSAERESFIGRRDGEIEITIPAAFIEKVLSHLSMSLERDYARSLYLADFGHGHFFIPLDEYREKVSPLLGFSQQFYDVLLNSKNLMVIYHAAEQMLKVLDGWPVEDPISRHYIDRRNILGSFADVPETSYLPPEEGNLHNTRSSLNGYVQYGDFEFTWNKNACFSMPAAGRNVYVDLSFESPVLRVAATESEPN
jgi:hypothetical protein